MMGILVGFLLLPAAIGLFVIYHIARSQRPPADKSNRINKIRLLWFTLTREDLFTQQFPWLLRDESANVEKGS
jgi:hypothetical protein